MLATMTSTMPDGVRLRIRLCLRDLLAYSPPRPRYSNAASRNLVHLRFVRLLTLALLANCEEFPYSLDVCTES